MIQLKADGALANLPYTVQIKRYDPRAFFVASKYPLTDTHVVYYFDLPLIVKITVQLPSGAQPLWVVHTTAPQSEGFVEWKGEVATIDRLVRARGPASLLLVGDFNRTWGNKGFRQILGAGMTDGAAARARPFEMTWSQTKPIIPPVVRIDHVLTGSGVAVTTIATEERTGQRPPGCAGHGGLPPLSDQDEATGPTLARATYRSVSKLTADSDSRTPSRWSRSSVMALPMAPRSLVTTLMAGRYAGAHGESPKVRKEHSPGMAISAMASPSSRYGARAWEADQSTVGPPGERTSPSSSDAIPGPSGRSGSAGAPTRILLRSDAPGQGGRLDQRPAGPGDPLGHSPLGQIGQVSVTQSGQLVADLVDGRDQGGGHGRGLGGEALGVGHRQSRFGQPADVVGITRLTGHHQGVDALGAEAVELPAFYLG